MLLQDSTGLLESVGVTSIDELKAKLSSKSALSLTLELTEADPAIKAESVVRLLKQNNRNIEYQKLKTNGVSDEVIAKIKELPLSPVALKNLVRLPDPQLFPMPTLSQQAIDLFNAEKLKVLNRKLRLADQLALDSSQFKQIQSAFERVEIVDNFGNLNQQFQNVLVKDDTSARPAGFVYPSQANRAAVLDLPPGYHLGNYEMELDEGVSSDFPFADNCYIVEPQLPMFVSQAGNSINSSLVTSDSGNATIKLPQTGIAMFAVSSENVVTVNLQRSDGFSLLNQQVVGTYYIYLPITQDDTCQPFTFTGASNNYSIRLIDIKSTERLNHHFYFEGNEYLSPERQIELINSNPFFNAQSYSFSSINSLLNRVDLLFKMKTSSAGNTGFDVLIFSPSGKAYSATQYGITGFHTAWGFDQGIARENGVWRVDLLPPGSTQTTLNQLTGITARVTDENASGRYLNVLAAVNTDPQVQTREFVLGLLKNVSLKTQGDDGDSNEGEISLTLNTTMAPKLNAPSYLEDLLARDGTMNDQIALWQCWIKSEKTGHEFETNAECYEYKDEFDTQQGLYEHIREYDSQHDPQYYRCRDENGDEAVCIRGENGYYGDLNITEPEKVKMVMEDYANTMNREYQDVEYLNILSNYYDLYLNWKDRSVQIDTGKFPYDGLAYKTRESSICDITDAGCVGTESIQAMLPYFDSPVIIETNRPVFGVPADRVNQSTLPINFDYLAIDQDEYDTDAELFTVLAYAATQVYNIATGNFVGLVCNSVGLLDDLHQLEKDAEDEALGSARVSINRYSSSDPFYGLHTAKNFNFFISGVPEGNTQIDTHGQTMNYAQMACGVAGLATSGYNFFQRADFLLSLDYAQFGEHADLVQAIAGIAGAINSADLALQADAIATMIENGQFDQARERLKLNTNINNLTQGTDVYADLDALLNTFSNEASAANGNNIIKSNAHYLLDEGRKTRAQVEFQRIHSVPVLTLSVTLDSLKIISNQEDDNDASVQIKPFVGLINDRPRDGLNTHSLFSDQDDGSNAASGYLRFYGVADGDILTPHAQLLSATGSNVAAIYVELAIIEDDGMSVEDDDMIGVFSQTFKLEEIFNSNAEFKWNYLGGNDYQLEIRDYPVYNSRNQRTLENPLSADYELQKKHNRNRSPGALVNLTIRLQVGDLTDHYPQLDSAIAVSEVNAGKDTYSMNMNEINSLDIVDIASPELFDVLAGLAIVTPSGHAGIDGVVFRYDVETFALTELFRYDATNFSGELLPIKKALSAANTISSYVADGLSQNRAPALIKLLPNNRILFAISGDDGARLMIVSFTNQGVMTLESSQTLIEADGSPIYSLMDATLSPDRSRLLVPYIPQSYKSGDKTQAVHSKVMYFQLQGNDFIYRDTIENVAATIAGAEFVGNDAISLTLKKLAYVTSSSTVWDWLDSYLKDLHAACSSSAMNCLYEVLSRDVLIYQIDESGMVELIESFDHYSAPVTYASGKTVNHYSALQNHLIDAAGISHAETISATGASAVLRYNRTVYQLGFDMNVNGFVKTGSSSLTPRKQIRYNPVGLYYCAEGLSCSGYLQPANAANSNDENTYVSPDRVIDFDFADYVRDLILSIDTQAVDATGNSCNLYTYVDTVGTNGLIGGTSFISNPDCHRQSQLKLTSLYDGPAAFKGPQISGDIFDTEVTMDGANDIAGLAFYFDVTDRDTRIDQLTVTVTAQNDPFNETIKAPFKIHSPLYTARCETTQEGHGSCSGSIIPDYENASFKQNITVSVSDGLYTSERNFSLFLDREAPLLIDSAQTVPLVTPEAYQLVDMTFDSATSASSMNCTNTSYCYLINNGFVDAWDWVNKPAWLSCVEQTSAAYGSQLLRCIGQPPVGQAGSYMMQINAYQAKGSAYQKAASMMMTLNVAEPDVQPDAFSFPTQSDTALDTLLESAPITVYGLTGYATLSLDQGEYWRSSSGLWSSAAASNIVNGEIIKLRLQSSTEFSTATTANLTLGGIAGSFTLNTKADPNANDSTPDAFSFTALTGQPRAQLVASNTVTVSGIWIASPVTVSNGEYQIGTGGWTSQPAQLENGQAVAVRHTTSDSFATEVVTRLTIGGVSAEFRSTTLALLAPVLSTSTAIVEPVINTLFEFTPINTGGDIASWSIVNKPAWASFDSATGQLTGIVDSLNSFSIEITASNATGSDTFIASVNVQSDNAPIINGYASSCSIDNDWCDFSFSDNPGWRASVNRLTIGAPYGIDAPVVLFSPNDYELSAGNLRLKINAINNMVKQGGNYQLLISATGYSDSSVDFMLDGGAAVVGTFSVTPAFSAGQVSTVSAQVTNRFGIPFSYAEVITELNIKNLTPNIDEVYKARESQQAAWQALTLTSFYSDSTGNVSFQLGLPGCISIDDGFQLNMGAQSVQYLNSASDCIDVDWINREAYIDLGHIAEDSQGNSYMVYSSNTDFAGIIHLGASTLNDLYLVKLDRNGEQRWVRAIATNSFETVASLVIVNDEIYIAGSTGTDGDIDGAGDQIALGMNDQFVVKYNTSGDRLWTRQFGTALNDSVYIMATYNNQLYLISKVGFTNEAPAPANTAMYTLSLDGTSLQMVMDNTTSTALIDRVAGSYSFMQIDAAGNFYLVEGNDVYKFNNNGLQLQQSKALSKNIDAMVLTDNALCVASDAADINATAAVKISCFNTSDLDLRWEKLIESNAPYLHEANSNARLAVRDNVVYALLSSSAEIYYDATLSETPNQTLNLIAFNADDGSELNHQSWITEVRSDALVMADEVSIGSTGNIYLKGRVTHTFNSSLQIGYIQVAGAIQYPQNTFLIKTSLAATATPLPLTGLTRSGFTNVVTDHDHALQWDDDFSSEDTTATWSLANNACQTKVMAGYTDWRLATDVELQRGAAYTPQEGSRFVNYNPVDWWYYYWTGLENSPGWHVAIKPQGPLADAFDDNDWLNFRCVRDKL